MRIEQVEKTEDYIYANLRKEDLHFLKYEEYPSKGKKNTIRRLMSTRSVMNMTPIEIKEHVDSENIILIKMES